MLGGATYIVKIQTEITVILKFFKILNLAWKLPPSKYMKIIEINSKTDKLKYRQ